MRTRHGPIYVWDLQEFKSLCRKHEHFSASHTKNEPPTYLYINVTKLEGPSPGEIWQYNSTFILCILT